LSYRSNQEDVGKVFKVLIEGNSKKSENDWSGRSSQNKMMVFSKGNYDLNKGSYADVLVKSATGATLIGEIILNGATN